MVYILVIDMIQPDCPFILSSENLNGCYYMIFWDFQKNFLINRGYIYSTDANNLHEALEELLKKPNFVDLKILEKQKNTAIIKTVIKFTEAMSIIRKNGGYIIGLFFIRRGREIWNIGFDDRNSLEKTLSELEKNHEFQVKKDNYVDVKDLSLVLSNLNQIIEFVRSIKNLSSFELQLVEFAIKLGFYCDPKKININDFSSYFDLSKGYISKKLRRCVGKILEEVLKLKKSLEY